MPDRNPSRDKALMWLNDHLGETIEVSVSFGDVLTEGTQTFVAFSGVLNHWRQGSKADQYAALDQEGLREDITGLYTVGFARVLDLSWIPDYAVTRDWVTAKVAKELGLDPTRGFVVELANVRLTVNLTKMASGGDR